MQRKLDDSLDNVLTSPSLELFTIFIACVHIPGDTKEGSESLFNPLLKELLMISDVF
jgi:hypothetical protein